MCLLDMEKLYWTCLVCGVADLERQMDDASGSNRDIIKRAIDGINKRSFDIERCPSL